jgi:uridylate kinase
MKYKRILLKLSGESMMADNRTIDARRLDFYASEIKSVAEEGVEVAIVIGGGNIFRGLKGYTEGTDRVAGDYMGMLATVINALALRGALEKKEIKAHILSGLPVERIAEPMSSPQAIRYLEAGDVIIISGGTGNPFFTTDSAAVLRALEIKANVVLKGTRVDGVYDADPEKNSGAVKYDRLSYDEAISKSLKVMDLTAFTLCKENKLPVIVFNFNEEGNLLRLMNGESIGTVVGPE